MTITVNGNPQEIRPGTTVAELIDHLGLGKGAVAAEVNGKLVPKRNHPTTALVEGDTIELVSLVGGG